MDINRFIYNLLFQLISAKNFDYINILRNENTTQTEMKAQSMLTHYEVVCVCVSVFFKMNLGYWIFKKKKMRARNKEKW